jgi:Uri superfamily endonuclease
LILPVDNGQVLPRAPGTYALLIACPTAARIRIGRLGTMRLRPGYYIYVGSAFGPGGLQARIGHHQRAARRPHWHVDYLHRRAPLDAVWYVCGVRCEHDWAARLGATSGAVIPMPNFGSSDCGCLAHLFWFRERPPATAVGRALGRGARPRRASTR